MKNSLLLLFTIFLILSNSALAQNEVSFGLKAGANLANIHSSNLPVEEFTKNKFGFHAGALVEYRLSELFAIQTELLYSQQGTKSDVDYEPLPPPEEIEVASVDVYSQNYEPGYDYNATGKYNYLNLPVLAKFYVHKGLNVFAGPQVSVLLSAKDEFGPRKANVEEELDTFDFGLNAGVGYQSDWGAFVSANYYWGINNVSAIDYEEMLGFDVNLHQGVWQFSLGYKF